MTRRDAIWLATQAFTASGGQEFFIGWLQAAQSHEHAANPFAPPEPDRWSRYKPKFFSPEDFRILDEFTAILIPTDDQPGAREAHVAPYIDFVLEAAHEYAPEVQAEWRKAFDWLRKQGFGSLPSARKTALIEQMAAPERDRSVKHEGFRVYSMIKAMTIHAFYTSRVGLVDVLEYKGNAYLKEFPACTHPEHKKV